jgi:hypothetical protein
MTNAGIKLTNIAVLLLEISSMAKERLYKLWLKNLTLTFICCTEV